MGATTAPGISAFSGVPRVFTAKLPTTSGELFGRDDELAMLDAAWADARTRIVMLSAWGGVGKTALVNHWLNRMEQEQYRGAARVYGWSFYSQGTREDRQASGDEFLARALEWFGDPDPKQGGPWDKGVRLAALVRQQRTLLILDGLEPLQYPPGVMKGELRDQGVKALVKELARAGTDWGLCVITTRVPAPELLEMRKASVKHHELENLSDQAGRHLLRSLGVTKGTDRELEEAAREYKGHALALTLLGRYLAVVHDGEIRKRDLIPALEAEEERGGHARRVMLSYERLLEGKPELDILYMLGLFDRPAEAGAIQALRDPPVIDGLTNALAGLPEQKWKYALHHLRELGLVAPRDDAEPGTLDCHPLIREHFGAALQTKKPPALKEGHSRLFEYCSAQPKSNLPEKLAEVMALYQAVMHGCLAGRHQEALDDVYMQRIQRGRDRLHASRTFGTLGAELAVLSCFFFNSSWEQLVDGICGKDRVFVLDGAGFFLRSVGRLSEALRPSEEAVTMAISIGDNVGASESATDLSRLYCYLGRIPDALDAASLSVLRADESGEPFCRVNARTVLAQALHEAGRLGEAEKIFREAEAAWKEHCPDRPILYAARGFRYCDLLLSRGEFEKARQHALCTLEWAKGDKDKWLHWIALDHLTLGRSLVLAFLAKQTGDLAQAAGHLGEALDTMRKSGKHDHVPLPLLARAALYRVSGAFADAWRDLMEAYEIAERGEMRLFLADYHLEAARLSWEEEKSGVSRRESESEEGEAPRLSARGHLDIAKKMVEEMGYGRRKPEVEELEKQLGSSASGSRG